MLLDGISMYGMGNFRDVATHVHSKTEAQCLAHYTTEYLKSGASDSVASVSVSAPSTSASSRASTAAATSTAPQSTAHVPKTEIGGYFPLRGDFDIEYDNDAEKILADSECEEHLLGLW